MLAVSLIMPVASRQAMSLGASPMKVGLLGIIFGTLQLISAPIVGRCGDVIGRRRILLLCLFFTSLGYIAMGLSSSLLYYLLARILLGLFKHSLSITRVYLAETTPKDQRARVIGYFNGISNLGFVIGPVVGGYLAETENGFYKVSILTAAIFALWFGSVLLFMSENQHTGSPNAKSVKDFTASGYIGTAKCFSLCSCIFVEIIKSSPKLFFICFLQGFSNKIFHSNFSLMLEQKFNCTPIITGRIIAFGAFVSALCAPSVDCLVRIYGSMPRLYLHSSALRIVALFLIIIAPNIQSFLIFYFLLSIGTSVARICFTLLSIEQGKVEDTGALLGLNQSVKSIYQTISPLISGFSLEVCAEGPPIISVVLSIATTGLIATLVSEEKKVSDKKKE